MTKLNDKKIQFLCREIVDKKEWRTGEIAALYGVSKRRVRQLTQKYRETGEIPKLNPNRRPKSPPLTYEEKMIIDEVWSETRFGARLLYNELKKRGYKIPRHKIHRYLVATGRSRPNPRKQRRRKRCRYERGQSFELIHGDSHRTTEDHPYAIIWMDDASRKILAGGEFPELTMDHAIATFKEAERVAMGYNAFIREVNTDRGSEFVSNHPGSISRFQQYLLENGIKHIISRKSNPQTNGKIERFWYEYDRHRWRFNTLEEFIRWYNNRLHGALWLEIGETPDDALIRKLPPESLLGLFMRWSR
jgi:transposase InsO family protein